MMKQPIQSGKLTKKFLIGLPDGVYLASGVGLVPGQPSFAESVVAASKREEQWRRIVDVRANGRACAVFPNAADFLEFSLHIEFHGENN